MLQIRNLTLIHRKDLRTILQDFNLALNNGDKAVIIGEEGNGKSTVIKWIFDPKLVEDYADAEGERILGGERLGYLAQELPTEDKGKTVYEYFSQSPSFFEKTPKDLAELTQRFKVDRDFFYAEQLMDSLSGGEKVKAQLMRILMEEPTVLLLDEPSNDIDIDTLELLEKLILDWPGIVLFVSHDETLIENTANVIIHIEQLLRKTVQRYTVARTDYRSYAADRENRFNKQEQEAWNDRRQKKLRDEKYRRIQQAVDRAQASISRQDPSAAKNLKDKMHTVKSMGKRFERADAQMTEIPHQEEAMNFILGEGVEPIPSGKTVLKQALPELTAPGAETKLLAKDVNLVVRGSEKVCIIGRNGAGKSTLIKIIAKELLDRKDIRAAYMPQNYEDLLDFDKTPVEYLDTTGGDKEERSKIRTYLAAIRYTFDETDRPIRELSGGQKAKVFLMKMNLSGANVLILDEPTRNFSPLSGPVIRAMIRDFPGAVISISHDRKFIGEVCDTVYELTPEGLKRTEM